jgi:hypothetical protein
MFEINDPQVVAETIDGEVVIINMERGTYFNIKNVNVDATGAGEDVERFVETLLADGLLRRCKDPIRREHATNVCTIPNGAYRPPELEKFTDMESLLLLDPIHDVDQKGWPHVQ